MKDEIDAGNKLRSSCFLKISDNQTETHQAQSYTEETKKCHCKDSCEYPAVNVATDCEGYNLNLYWAINRRQVC